MAETILISIAKSGLEQLSSPASKEFQLLWNFKKELRKLSNTAETINDVLQDAEKRQFNEQSVQRWLARLRAVMYDVDDLFDAVDARCLRKKAMTGNAFKKEVCLFFSKSNQLGFIVKTAHEVKAIRERLDGIAGDINEFGFLISRRIEEKPVLRLIDREETHSFVREKDVVGRGQEKEDIINLLLDNGLGEEGASPRDLSVITIIGFGGLGKTTLAQLVYNDGKVKRDFDLCLWVCINYFSNLKDVLLEIITSAFKSKPGDLNLDGLQEKLRESIGGKKYLLVMDDVWDEDVDNWRKLKPLLSCGKSGSKVLVTTRSTKVAHCLDALKPYYQLKVLSKESAWSLFVKMAFEDRERGKYPELEPAGRNIVQKCGNVPLAITTIGGMLRLKEREKKVWLHVLEELPEGLLGNNDYKKIMEVLKVSYNDLPAALKQCFAYCSLFPKDYRFDKDELVRLWQAQGFLNTSSSEQNFENVGDAYFFYLVDACFFQEVKSYNYYEGCVGYSYKMHDLLHDLAAQVVGMESKCFTGNVPSGMGVMSTLRHIFVNFQQNLDYSGLLSHSEALRTLLLLPEKPWFKLGGQFNANSLNTLLRRFRMLRTFRLTNSGINTLPDSIGKLIHLRYLDLSHNLDLKTLPKSICKLYHLQILRLERCASLKELPSNIGKLVSLRQLFLIGCENLAPLPSGLAALTSLVTLDRFIVHHHNGGLRYLDRLNNLCGVVNVELPGHGWSNAIEDARKSNILRKDKLTGFGIIWKGCGTDSVQEVDKNVVEEMLEVLQPHDNIEYLSISGYGGGKLSSWVFSLQNVKELNFQGFTLEYLEDRVRFDLFFPCLEILQIREMPNLKGWWRQVMAEDLRIRRLPCFSRVSKVVIAGCPNLMESMPLFGGTVTLELKRVNEKLAGQLLTGNMNCSSASSSSSSECHYNSKLKELVLDKIEGLTCLPKSWIGHLTALQNIRIDKSEDLSWVSCGGLARLTALKELRLISCGTVTLEDKDDEKLEKGMAMPWKNLQMLRDLSLPVGDMHFQKGLQYLTSLRVLEIGNWEEEQVIVGDEEIRECDGVSWKGLKRLRTLKIGFGGKKIRFPKGIQYLRSLQVLLIKDCKELSLSWTTIVNRKLRSLDLVKLGRVVNVDEIVAEERRPLSSLVQLSITECSNEDEWVHHQIKWRLLSSLRCLFIKQVSKLGSIPDGIQHLTSLKRLYISDCEEIRAIPNWMVNLTSLQYLKLLGCSEELEKRCERGTGVDWPLISHVPHPTVTQSSEDPRL